MKDEWEKVYQESIPGMFEVLIEFDPYDIAFAAIGPDVLTFSRSHLMKNPPRRVGFS
jgi:hypothetical protein